MADVEQRIINTQLSGKIEIVDAKFNQFMEEMRSRDDKRAAEVAEIRNDIKEIYKATDSKFEKLSSQLQNMAIAIVVGVGALVVGVISFVVSNIPKG